MVPGHEMTGVVRQVGPGVKKFKVGQRVGVGVFIDCCDHCGECKDDCEQYCPDVVASYNCRHKGGLAFGGYSQCVTVREKFVVSIPDGLDLAAAAPLLCAGITMYSPLVHFGARAKGPSWKVGVVGIGGLGHVGAKLAKAFGNDVTVISRDYSKKAFADKIGVKYLAMNDRDAWKANERSFDYIISTVSADIPSWTPYLKLLKVNGNFTVVGLPPKPMPIQASDLCGRRVSLAGSQVGSMKELNEMLQFCATHKIVADIELISAVQVNEKLQDLAEYGSREQPRFVINVKETFLPGNWDVRGDSRINPKNWTIRAKVEPPSSNIHNVSDVSGYHQKCASTCSKRNECRKNQCAAFIAAAAVLGLGAAWFMKKRQ